MSKTYTIEGMHCASCVRKVTAALAAEGYKARVTLDPPQAQLNGEAPEVEILNAALAKAGAYKLVDAPAAAAAAAPGGWLKTYFPLLLIVGLISVASFSGAAHVHDWMLNFMAGFFITFGAFKLLDIRGFRDAYASYDLLAARWKEYGLLYPFIELALGFAFLFRFEITLTLWLSLAVMGVSSLGVLKALREKRELRCACLGTTLKLPMSTITLVEDLGMVAMSALMLMA